MNAIAIDGQRDTNDATGNTRKKRTKTDQAYKN